MVKVKWSFVQFKIKCYDCISCSRHNDLSPETLWIGNTFSNHRELTDTLEIFILSKAPVVQNKYYLFALKARTERYGKFFKLFYFPNSAEESYSQSWFSIYPQLSFSHFQNNNWKISFPFSKFIPLIIIKDLSSK